MNVEIERFDMAKLAAFSDSVFAKLGVSFEDGNSMTKVLLEADMRSIPSHGIARLRRLVNALRDNVIAAHPQEKILKETENTIVVDADGGMGSAVSTRVMNRVIEKAKKCNAAFGCVRNSGHFGIAGYYARMPLEHDMVGIAMTNTAALGVPTFGRQVMYGTNPFAFAAPAGKEPPFLLDMATTVVTRGKLEVCEREKRPLTQGWAVDRNGNYASDPTQTLDDMQTRVGGGILPLGGLGEEHSGHKGYGLAVMVDILCALLCNAPFGQEVRDMPRSMARVSHFFGAMRIDAFGDAAMFRSEMDRMLGELRNSAPAEGQDRVYYAGLKSAESKELALKIGVPLSLNTVEELRELAAELGLEFPNPIEATV